MLFAFVNTLMALYIIAIVVLQGLIPVVLQWLIGNRYVSTGSILKRSNKRDLYLLPSVRNVSGEIDSALLAGRSLA